jgi:flagellar hook-basal body complex protein FliE
MNISSIANITDLNQLGTGTLTKTKENNNTSFESMFQAAVNMIKQTNDYTNAAEEAETAYALGLTDSTHDLQIAQQKANLSLQYTVAVRNAVMDAYKEIMNLQF